MSQKVGDEQGNEVLSDLDTLFIVHVNNGKVKEKWDAGGPILPRLSTALANYPHQIVELEVRSSFPAAPCCLMLMVGRAAKLTLLPA